MSFSNPQNVRVETNFFSRMSLDLHRINQQLISESLAEIILGYDVCSCTNFMNDFVMQCTDLQLAAYQTYVQALVSH